MEDQEVARIILIGASLIALGEYRGVKNRGTRWLADHAVLLADETLEAMYRKDNPALARSEAKP